VRRVSIKILLCVKDKRVAGHPMAGAGGCSFLSRVFLSERRIAHVSHRTGFGLNCSGVGDLVLAYPLNCLEHLFLIKDNAAQGPDMCTQCCLLGDS
jgi:hypothetical protein